MPGHNEGWLVNALRKQFARSWQSKGGDIREGGILLTTAANVLLAPLYNKMPVLLHQRELDNWLRGERPILQELNDLSALSV